MSLGEVSFCDTPFNTHSICHPVKDPHFLPQTPTLMDVKSDSGIWQTLFPLPVLSFREMEGERGRDSGSRSLKCRTIIDVLNFPGWEGQGSLPEVSWDCVVILNPHETRRGLCES